MLLIQTTHLLLRDPVDADLRRLAAYQADPRYLEHYLKPPDSALILRLAKSWALEEPRKNFQLMICLKAEQNVIGCIGLRASSAEPGEAEVGIEIDPDHWGNGYASEALRGIIELAEELTLRTLRAATNVDNNRAIALLKKTGFRLDRVAAPFAYLSLELPFKPPGHPV